MSPEYFHTRLTYGEADDFLCGMNRRYRAGYDQSRMVAATIGKLFAKDYRIPTFPWEKERTQTGADGPSLTEEDIKEMRRESLALERMLNSRNRQRTA